MCAIEYSVSVIDPALIKLQSLNRLIKQCTPILQVFMTYTVANMEINYRYSNFHKSFCDYI